MPSFSELLHHARNLEELIRLGGLTVLTAIVYTETGLMVGFFLPGDSLLVTAGLLAGAGHFDIVNLNLLLSAAAILGDATGYMIGRRLGRALFEKKSSRLFRREHLIRTQLFYERHGGKTIIMARFIPILRTFTPIVTGIARVPYRKYVTFNVIGAIGWVFSMTMIGYVLGRFIPNVNKYIEFVVITVIILSMMPPFIASLRERKHRKAENARFLSAVEDVVESLIPVRWEWTRERLAEIAANLAATARGGADASRALVVHDDGAAVSHVEVTADISPERHTLTDAAFEHTGWEFERKYREAIKWLSEDLMSPEWEAAVGDSGPLGRHGALRAAGWQVDNGRMLLLHRKDETDRFRISIVVEPLPESR